MKVAIRKSLPNDVFGIREVQHITWLDTYPNVKADITKEDIEDKFKNDQTPEGQQKIEENNKKYNNPNFYTYVAETGNKIVGFCIAGVEGGIGRIIAIYLLPEYQGQGIGSILFQKALMCLNNINAIYINVVEYNKKAISFYKKHDFFETGKKGAIDTAATLPSGKTMPEIELVKINKIITA